MKTNEFISALLPTLRRDQILDSIRNTRVELKDTTLPACEVAVSLLGKWKWKSEALRGHAATFARLVKGGNLIAVIEAGLKESVATLALAEDYILKTYNEEVSAAALTFRKANVLQFVEAVAFASKFARKFINYAFVLETAPYEDGETVVKDALAPAEIRWIDDNFIAFCTAFSAVAQPVKVVEAAIEHIPEITIKSADIGALTETIGEKRLDPFRFGFISARTNPFYWLGRWNAEYQVERYNAAKDELRLVQLRKLNLEKLNERKPDAALQHEIQYLESRVQGLNAKIAKMEARDA